MQKTVGSSKKRIGKRYRNVQKIKKIRGEHRAKLKKSRRKIAR